VVKRLNSCEDMLAVWGLKLKLKLEAVLEVRFSGKGKAEWLRG
jgi:hypothetical protein